MDIIFNPPTNEENQYIRLMVGELNGKGYRIHALANLFSSFKHFRSIKLIHLNWFENVDDSNLFIALRSFFRKMAVLVAIRLSRKPLVWTMHNRTSHEKELAFFSRALVYFLQRWSDRIVVHSRQSEAILSAVGDHVARKMIYVPHPNFIHVYGEVATAIRPPGQSALHLLFIGMVKPYKNLELLIDVVQQFGTEVRLTIAGKAVSPAYQRYVQEKSVLAGNVTFLPHFIPDGELSILLAKADVVVLPYDLNSSLNSGTVILAFSYKRTVICPEIGTITDLGELQKEVFHYRYDHPSEHREALSNQIAEALLVKQTDPARLSGMGGHLYDYVKAEHDKQLIVDQLDDMYLGLIERRNNRY